MGGRAHGKSRRRSFSKRVHQTGEIVRRHEGLASYCDHRGVGLPGCLTCDPRQPDERPAA